MQQGNLSTEKNQPDRLKIKGQPNRKKYARKQYIMYNL